MENALVSDLRKKITTIKNIKQNVPQHGLLYFDHLTAELNSKVLSISESETEIKEAIEDILQKRVEGNLSWNDLYTFDLILSQRLQPERLAREVWSLRSRYRAIAGLREYEAYLASKPPDPTGLVEEKALRADIEYLLSEIYLRYAITPVNQDVRDRILWRVTVVIIICILIILAVVLINNYIIAERRIENPPATLIVVLFVGSMGGLLSMLQRYQSVSREGDPIDNISEMTQGWSRLFLPAISGAIFAMLLYMLIMGGLLKGDLFPEIYDYKPDNNQSVPGIDLSKLLEKGRPTSLSGYAKLIIWSFLAGFAERFVPDTLSSFISKRGGGGKGEA